MSSYGFRSRAAKYTRVGAGTTKDPIESGNTITVYGFMAANASSNSDINGHETVTFFESDGTTTILTLQIPNGSTIDSHTEWLADKGLKITTATNCTVTVWHSQAGS